MEAVLNLGQGCHNLAIILRGMWGEGRKWSAGQLSVITFIGGEEWEGEGKEGREREQIFPCTKCSHVHVDSTLSLFFISPFCCCSLSRYKKVPQERYRVFRKGWPIFVSQALFNVSFPLFDNYLTLCTFSFHYLTCFQLLKPSRQLPYCVRQPVPFVHSFLMNSTVYRPVLCHKLVGIINSKSYFLYQASTQEGFGRQIPLWHMWKSVL